MIEVPREQKMLKGHLPRVIYHQVYQYTKKKMKPERKNPGVQESKGKGAGIVPRGQQALGPRCVPFNSMGPTGERDIDR